MTTPAEQLAIATDQSQQSSFYIDNMGIISVKSFGAVGDGVTDDTSAVEDAIEYIEDNLSGNDYDVVQVYSLFFPAGHYIVNDALISYPILVHGDGRNSTIISTTENGPVFTVKGVLTADLHEADSKTIFRNLCIKGTYDDTNTDQHGIYVKYEAGRVARVEVDWCTIFHCSGHGIYSETAASNRIHNCIIAKNKLDGIYFTGNYNTDFHIHENVIRENRRGVVISPTDGQYFVSGWIYNNLFESNYYGSGQVGSATRPGVGIWLLRAQRIRVQNNYFEDQLNDIYVESNVSYCVFSNNHHNNGNEVPGYFTGYSGPARQVGAYYFDGSSNTGNIIKENDIYTPNKPGDTDDDDWGTATWGSSYEHIPNGMGTHGSLIENYATDPTSGDISDVEYPSDPNYFIYFRGLRIESASYKKRERAYQFRRESPSSIFDVSLYHYLESPSTAAAGVDYFVYPDGLAGDLKRTFTLSKRNSDGTKTDIKDLFHGTTGGLLFPVGGYSVYSVGDYRLLKIKHATAGTTEIGIVPVGSITWNSNPSGGNPMGWMCTVAGTSVAAPTWTAMANL